MRFYCNINENPRALVAGLGSNIVLGSGVEVKRRDAGDIELQLFSGVQGGVLVGDGEAEDAEGLHEAGAGVVGEVSLGGDLLQVADVAEVEFGEVG